MESKKKMTIVAIILIVAIAGGLIFLVNSLLPHPDITSVSKDLEYTGSYTLYIDVDLVNRGGSGEVTVWFKVTQGINSWKKSKKVYMRSGERLSMRTAFHEVSGWDTDSHYEVWCET